MNLNVFKSVYKKSYLLTHPIVSIKHIKNSILQAWRRATRGYCDVDAYCMNDWFLRIISDMLETLNKGKGGFPPDMTYDEWTKILDEMRQHFINAQEDHPLAERKCSLPAGAPGWGDEFCELYDWRMEEFEKGIDMFKKYFWTLWD